MFGKDSDDVLEELKSLQHKLGVDNLEQDSILELERLRGKHLYHYHLTINMAGDVMWSYKIICFVDRPVAGKLTAFASFLPKAGVNKKDHEYKLEASIDRTHLAINTRRADGSPDIGIEVFRDFATHSSASLFPLYGAKIMTTWCDDALPTLISYLFGMLLLHKSSNAGPMVHVIRR